MEKTDKKLEMNLNSPFLSELDQTNPYGPNYEGLPLDTKIYYKFSRIRKYVHYDMEDQRKIMLSNIGFVSGMFLSGAFGVFLGKFGMRLWKGRIRELIEDYHHLYIAVLGSGSATIFYSIYSDQQFHNISYIEHICKPFIQKYENEAIKNGFETYTISQYKTLNFEEEYYNSK